MLTPRRSAIPLLAALAPALLPALASAKTPTAARPSKQYTIEQFMATTGVGGLSFSADESRVLVHTNKTGIFNVYTIPLRGGEPTPLTQSASDSTFAVSFFPKDDRVLYTRDQGGNEQNHLYLREPDGQEKDLTPGPRLKASFAGWKRDATGFYVVTNERDARFFDVYLYDAASYERKLLYKDEVGYQLGAISDDGNWIAFEKPKSTSDSDIYLWSAKTGELKHVTPHEGEADHSADTFDPESRYLYYRANTGGEFLRVRRYELATGKHEEVESAGWDILYTYFSETGKYRVSGVNADGRTIIKLYETATGKAVPLPKLPDGEISSVRIARSEKRMAFYVNGDRSPNNLYAYDFGDKAPRRLTATLSKQIDPADLVEAEVTRFRSFDGTLVPNILYRPHQASAAHRAPALVWVHGGPGGQTRRGYSSQIQYLVNHGYVVLGINNRGSSGYGKSFYTADDQKHGREPLWDCVVAKSYLASLPYVDRDRIGIIGGSYGGYMVLAALAFRPEAFGVGVDIFGVSNWLRTLESMPSWWEAQRLALYKEMGDPGKDKEMLREVSPLFHADKIKRPLMVLQGANDPRVIKPESDDIVAAVRKNSVPVEYVVFPDEGHGFTKKKNQIEAWGKILAFLDKHLKS